MGAARQGRSQKHSGTPGRRGWNLMVSGLAAVMVLAGAVTWALLAGPGQPSDAGQAGRGPRIAVDKDLIDFGIVPYRKFVEASFRVRNVGDAPLALPANPPLDVLEGC